MSIQQVNKNSRQQIHSNIEPAAQHCLHFLWGPSDTFKCSVYIIAVVFGEQAYVMVHKIQKLIIMTSNSFKDTSQAMLDKSCWIGMIYMATIYIKCYKEL